MDITRHLHPGRVHAHRQPVGNGSVATAPDQATYHDGDTVELTPTAAAGWTFSGWSGDLSGSDDPATVTVHGDMAITATFRRVAGRHRRRQRRLVQDTDATDASGESVEHRPPPAATSAAGGRLGGGGGLDAGSATGREISSVTVATATVLTPMFTQPAGTRLRYSAIEHRRSGE